MRRRRMRTLDDLQNGYAIYQETDGFRFGIDAVLLAHFPKINDGERVLDLGTGAAVIPHILAARAGNQNIDIQIDGLELEDKAFACAQDAVVYNGLQDVIRIRQGNVKEAPALYGEASFSLVTANPPYGKIGTGKVSPDRAKAMARWEIEGTLDDWVHAAASVLEAGGRLAMVHRPARLTELSATLRKHSFCLSRKRLVQPLQTRAANLVLIEAVKEMRATNALPKEEAPLVVYREDGSYTDEVLAIYKGEEG